MSITPRILIQEADFDIAAEYAQALARMGPGQCGAVASFVGLVRDQVSGPGLAELFLEHYPGMTEQSMQDLVAQALDRWDLLDLVVIHRVGALHPDEQIVFVQAASAHRAEAFSACEFVMDYLKTAAIFWKRETSSAGNQAWVESTSADLQRAATWAADGTGNGSD